MDTLSPKRLGCLGALIITPMLSTAVAEAQSGPSVSETPIPMTDSDDGSMGLSTDDEASESSAVRDGLRFHAGVRTGFGGQFEADTGSDSVSDDMSTTFGAQLGVDYGLLDFFTLGAEMRLGRVITQSADDAGANADLFIDVVAKPRARHFVFSDNLELYAAVPFGVTFVNLDDENLEEAAETNREISAGPGFNLGVAGGSTYHITDSIGINAEAAYLMTWFGTETVSPVINSETDNSLAQMTLMVNAEASF